MEQTQTKNNLIGWWKKVVIENYANFKGRARRSEFWYFVLGSVLLFLPFYVLIFIGIALESSILMGLGGLVCGLLALALIVPYLAVVVRRLHDIGKSGWYYFVGWIPFVGGIIMLVWFCTDGNRFANKWGEDPKNPIGPAFDFEHTNPAIQG